MPVINVEECIDQVQKEWVKFLEEEDRPLILEQFKGTKFPSAEERVDLLREKTLSLFKELKKRLATRHRTPLTAPASLTPGREINSRIAFEIVLGEGRTLEVTRIVERKANGPYEYSWEISKTSAHRDDA